MKNQIWACPPRGAGGRAIRYNPREARGIFAAIPHAVLVTLKRFSTMTTRYKHSDNLNFNSFAYTTNGCLICEGLFRVYISWQYYC